MEKSGRTQDDELRVARALAIEHYAKMESVLCVLLANLLGIRHDEAAVVFYRITSADARNSIIKTLIVRAHGDKFKAFWSGSSGAKKTPKLPGMWNFIEALDEERNYIVHWSSSSNVLVTPGLPAVFYEELRPAFHATRLTHLAPIATPQINEFIQRADYAHKLLQMFYVTIKKRKRTDPALPQTWLPIFQQPPMYPPPADHPVQPLLERP